MRAKRYDISIFLSTPKLNEKEHKNTMKLTKSTEVVRFDQPMISSKQSRGCRPGATGVDGETRNDGETHGEMKDRTTGADGETDGEIGRWILR
jgi:hypothetical protein